MKKIKLTADKLSMDIEAVIPEVRNSSDFVKVSEQLIVSSGFRGIVFHLKDKTNNNTNRIRFLTNETGFIKLVGTQSNTHGWDIGNKVRIMYFNDTDPVNFQNAIPYFMARLEEFKYEQQVSDADYEEFTKRWNDENGGDIDNYKDNQPTLQPKQTVKDDILTIS